MSFRYRRALVTSDDVLARYETHLRRRGLRPASIDRTMDDLRLFVAAFMWWDQVSTAELERWLDARRIGPRTRYGWVSRLGVFYRWAIDEGLTTHDPARLAVRPKLPELRARPIPVSDVAGVLLLTPPGSLRTAIALARYAGLRVGEISRLRWRDVDEANGGITVVDGKGGKSRWVPIGPRLAKELPERGRPMDLVVGVSWSPETCSRRVREHLRACGVDATGHQLRHTYATEAQREGRSIATVQRLLGHASIATTQIYVRVDEEELRRVAELVG
jgi:integrase/recombinase XerD